MAETLTPKLILEASIDLKTRPRLAEVHVRNPILRYYARAWMAAVLWAADTLGLLAAIVLSLQLQRVGSPVDSYYGELFLLLAFIMLVLFRRRGLYPAQGVHYVQELRDIVSGTSFAFLIVIGATFMVKTSAVYSRLTIFVMWAVCLALIPSLRYLVRRLCIAWNLWGEPVAIVGHPRSDIDLAKFFATNLQLGFRPVVAVTDELAQDGGPGRAPAVTLNHIRDLAKARSIRTALVVINDLNRLDYLVERYRPVFERVILIKGSSGTFSLNSMKSLDLSGMLGLQVMNNLLSFWPQLFKRAADLVIAVAGLVVLAPFFGLTALLLRLTTTAPVYYRQKVLGRNGRDFEMLKFRTMVPNAGKVLQELIERDPAAKQEWDSFQKLRHDPRITPVGGLLRKFSLDELPQLWNVLRGDMSLVGPRPMMLSQQEEYGEALRDYIQVAPGMTGLWQVSGRNQTTFARRAELDREYIQRWTPWLDFFILVKTIKIVFRREGAY